MPGTSARPCEPLRLSIVVPVVDEAEGLSSTLDALQALRTRGHEVIVADGGSRDASVALSRARADRVVHGVRGRARQMNRGAREASGEILLFLHADTLLPANADALVHAALSAGRRHWGRFDVRLSGGAPLLRIVERLMSLRSHRTGIVTGDQAMFVRRATFERIGGFPEIALMEDIAISRELRRIERPQRIKRRAIASSRRWERHGIVRTVLKMWMLRLAYFFGGDPADLARRYDCMAP